MGFDLLFCAFVFLGQEAGADFDFSLSDNNVYRHQSCSPGWLSCTSGTDTEDIKTTQFKSFLFSLGFFLDSLVMQFDKYLFFTCVEVV